MSERGFTLIELLVAILILTVGLLGLAASTGMITRTLAGSRWATTAAQVGSRRLDILRASASATSPQCTAPGFTSSVAVVSTQGVSETWVVPATGALRRVLAIVTYPVGGGRSKTDTLATTVACGS